MRFDKAVVTRGGRHGLLKAGLLSISLVTGMQMAGLPAIPAMGEFFAGLPQAAIESLSTVQSLSAMVMVLASPATARVLGKRAVVALGVGLAAIAGLVPAFVASYPAILASRVVFGVGIGLFGPLSISLLADYFTGSERATMLGFRASVETFGQALSTPLAGALLVFGWQASYLVYLIALVPLVLFILGIPADAPGRQTDNASTEPDGSASKRHEGPSASSGKSVDVGAERPRGTVFGGMAAVVVMNALMTVAYASFEVRVSSIVVESGFGDAALAGVLVAVLAVSASVSGVLYGRLYELLGRVTGACGFLMMAAGLTLGAFANGLPLFIAAIVVAGASYPIALSFGSGLVLRFAGCGRESFGTSLFVSGGFIGSFLAPFALAQLAILMGSVAPAAPLLPLAIMLACLALLSAFIARR